MLSGHIEQVQHVLEWVLTPGNLLFVAHRGVRWLLGREVIADRPGERLDRAQVDAWLRVAAREETGGRLQ